VPLEVLFGIEAFSTLGAHDLRLPIVNYAVLFKSKAIREHLMTTKIKSGSKINFNANYLVANFTLDQTLARVFPNVVFQFLDKSPISHKTAKMKGMHPTCFLEKVWPQYGQLHISSLVCTRM